MEAPQEKSPFRRLAEIVLYPELTRKHIRVLNEREKKDHVSMPQEKIDRRREKAQERLENLEQRLEDAEDKAVRKVRKISKAVEEHGPEDAADIIKEFVDADREKREHMTAVVYNIRDKMPETVDWPYSG